MLTDDRLGPIPCPATTLAPGLSMTCTAGPSPAELGPYENLATVTGHDPVLDTTVVDSDTGHYLGFETPSITLQKSTNGVDADTTPGPYVPIGGRVSWTYLITNTGNVPLFWTITDDRGVPIACPRLGFIAPGGTINCFSNGIAEPGQYANIAEVRGTSPSGQVVTATDPSHYFGVAGAIELEKLINGQDVVAPPGPFIPVGAQIVWTYRVTNTGNSPLTDVTVEDLRGVVVSCPQDALLAGETMDCTASDTAIAEEYTDIAVARGTTPDGSGVQDVDASHYFGAEPGVNIEKSTNGLDADDPPGPFIPAGGAVTWQYVVTNSGNTALSDVAIVDDRGVVVSCPQTTLAVGAQMTCSASGLAVEGQYVNTATVTATDANGEDVTSSESSHSFGFVSGIDVEKSTNGDDADDAPGVVIPVGDQVTWTYAVTTAGNVAVRQVVLVDDQGVVPTFTGGDVDGDSQLDPTETWTYEATGTAQAGQYRNVATVTGLDVLERAVQDSDPSHHLGGAPSITVQKTPDDAIVDAGAPHTFTMEVTNDGNIDLTGVVVSDPLAPDCSRQLGSLAAGASTTYDCTLARVDAAVVNVVTTRGTPPFGPDVVDQDEARVSPRTQPPPTAAVIGDLVWEDNNENKVQDPGEPGIPGARVVVTDVVTGVAHGFTTDGQGMYRAVVVPGTYRIAVDLESVGSRLTTAAAYRFPIAAGEERLDADFGIVDDEAGSGLLPGTGLVVGGLVVLGLALAAGGAALVALRRTALRRATIR